MAEEEARDPDDEQEATEDGEAPAQGGGLVKKLMFAGIAVALLVAGIFGSPFVMNLISPPPEEKGEVTEAEEVVEPVDLSEPELFASLRPPLIINIMDTAGDSHFMQITMEVMARDQDIIDAVKNHIPVIRNSLILLYGSANYDVVKTREGKEQLLADGLMTIQKIMKERIGVNGVEALYFTALVVQ